MTRLEAFYPPCRSQFLVRLILALSRPLLRFLWSVVGIEISDEDMDRLRRLRHTGAIVISNHPSLTEPPVIFTLLGRAGVTYHSLVAWDTMALYGGLWRRYLQSMGGYSIMRGRRDRASMQMTQKLLANGERILIFPEGQTYGLNDILIPFQQGVVQMGFWAVEEMEKQRIDRPVLIAPLAIKYVYTRPMGHEVDASMTRLERALAIDAPANDRYVRLTQIAAAVMDRLEREQGIETQPAATLNERIDRYRQVMVERLAAAFKVELPREASFPMAVQLLANAHDQALSPVRADAPEGVSVPREQIAAEMKPLRAQWLRLKNFLAIRDDYIRGYPSAERYLDVLSRLEFEVLGKIRIRGTRKALVRCAEPINLWDHLEEYRAGKRETVARLTEVLQEIVGGILAELTQRTEVLT